MTFKKMLYLMRQVEGLHGQVMVTGGGELMFVFAEQPDHAIHQGILRIGFVYVDGDYIYRPCWRKKK